MTNEEAKAYFVLRLSDAKYANGKQTTQRLAFEKAFEALDVMTHRCTNCKHNAECMGVSYDIGKSIVFHPDTGYCCLWESE